MASIFIHLLGLNLWFGLICTKISFTDFCAHWAHKIHVSVRWAALHSNTVTCAKNSFADSGLYDETDRIPRIRFGGQLHNVGSARTWNARMHAQQYTLVSRETWLAIGKYIFIHIYGLSFKR